MPPSSKPPHHHTTTPPHYHTTTPPHHGSRKSAAMMEKKTISAPKQPKKETHNPFACRNGMMDQLLKSTDSIADGIAQWVADETTNASTAQFQPRAKSCQIPCLGCFPHKANPAFLNRCTLLSYSTIACLAPHSMRSHWLQSSRPWFPFRCSFLSFATPLPRASTWKQPLMSTRPFFRVKQILCLFNQTLCAGSSGPS